MREVASEIRQTVVEFAKKIAAFDDAAFSAKPAPEKWSKKEILGHLADSAQNNLQRFIRGQYEATPPRILYEQEIWVSLGNYQKYSTQEVITLWVMLNKHLCHVLESMDPSSYEKQCMTGKGELQPLTFFADDYLRHMLHHIDQINSN